MKIFKKIIASFLLVLTMSIGVNAQNEQSPYSKYGYGTIRDFSTSAQRSMGGVGIAQTGGRQINVMNPASYAGIDSLTLLWDIGIDLTRLWSEDNEGNTGKSFGGGLDYLTLQFPICKFMGGSIGLVPYSSVGYSFGGDINDENGNATGSSTFAGEGGINELYFGVSGKIFKGFTLGANISYQFGNITNDSYVTSTTGTTSLFEQKMEIRDWNILLGAQYTMNFRQLHKVTLGATYSPKKDFHGKTWGTYYDVNSDAKPGTVGYGKLKSGDYVKPNSIGVGVAYTYKNRLTFETDFTYQDWSKAKYSALKEGNQVLSEEVPLDDRWKIAAGIQYVPKVRGSYFERVAYRCGGFYTNDYVTVKNNSTREFGAALGFGFPTMGTKTIINLGFEYRCRKSHPICLVKENYFSVTLGVNFNEFAFWQNKIR